MRGGRGRKEGKEEWIGKRKEGKVREKGIEGGRGGCSRTLYDSTLSPSRLFFLGGYTAHTHSHATCTEGGGIGESKRERQRRRGKEKEKGRKKERGIGRDSHSRFRLSCFGLSCFSKSLTNRVSAAATATSVVVMVVTSSTHANGRGVRKANARTTRPRGHHLEREGAIANTSRLEYIRKHFTNHHSRPGSHVLGWGCHLEFWSDSSTS